MPEGPGKLVGIDLGTTFSAIATLDDHGQPVTLPNRDSEMLTPSAIFIDEGVARRGNVERLKLEATREGPCPP